MDADALQNQSATAFNGTMAAVQAKTKLIARILAETGIRDMFALLHGVIRKNDKRANTVRLRNKWVQVDPRNWKTRDDMTINVGLGTGSRAEQVAHLTNILGIQKEIVLSGPSQQLVKPKNIYNTLEKLIERVGLKTIEPYFSDPEEVDPQTGQPKQPPPPPPDPEMMKVQMEAQMAEKADQRRAEIEKVQAQADIATEQTKLQGEMSKQERDFQLKKELAMLQAALDQERFNREEARKDREHEQKMQMSREQHQAGMQQNEFSLFAGQEAHKQKMEQAKSNGASV
jgi:flagellar biosynthesis GTPase FlhF